MFDGALGVALAVSLEQSPFIKVFPEDRARDTLRLMERPTDQPITRSIAREIARREQLKALIAGSIASIGSHYVIALEAINTETGEAMAREQAEATSKENVLTALGEATTRLREKLGESLASVQRFDAAVAARHDAVARCAARILACALRRTRSAAPRVDPAFEARHRAGPDVRDGTGPALERLREHRTVGARAGVFRKGVRAARPGERTRTLFHLLALLPRRGSGQRQGARAGASLDGDLSARGIRVQRARQRDDSLRSVRAGRGPVAPGPPPRREVRAGVLESRGGVDGARQIRRVAHGADRGIRPETELHRRPAPVLSARVRAGRHRDDGERVGFVGRRQRDQFRIRLAGTCVGVCRTHQRRARTVSSRRAAGRPGKLSRGGGATADGGRRKPRRRGRVRRGAA